MSERRPAPKKAKYGVGKCDGFGSGFLARFGDPCSLQSHPVFPCALHPYARSLNSYLKPRCSADLAPLLPWFQRSEQ